VGRRRSGGRTKPTAIRACDVLTSVVLPPAPGTPGVWDSGAGGHLDASGSQLGYLRRPRRACRPPTYSVLHGMTVNAPKPSRPPITVVGCPRLRRGFACTCQARVHSYDIVRYDAPVSRHRSPLPLGEKCRPGVFAWEGIVGPASCRHNRTHRIRRIKALRIRVPACRSQSIFRTVVRGGRPPAWDRGDGCAGWVAYFELPSIQRPQRAPAQKTYPLPRGRNLSSHYPSVRS
jgi:hypothetical protein